MHTHDETASDEASLQDVTGKPSLPRDSTESLTEDSALSKKFTLNPTDISSMRKDLDQTEGTTSQSIFNEISISNAPINSSNRLTLPSERVPEMPSNQMVGTFSESHSKMFTNIYRNSPVRLEKRILNVTTEDFSNHSEIPAKGQYRMVGDQPTYLSAEIYNPYPRVATENAYIILHDVVSNPTEPSTTQSNLSSGNSTEISSVLFTKDTSEGHSAGSCKHSVEKPNEHSDTSTTKVFRTSTGNGSTLTTEQPFTNRTESGPDRSGERTQTTRSSSRRTRDHSGSTGRRMETSKLNASRNADDTGQFTDVTSDTVSTGQTTKRSSHRGTKFPSVRAIGTSAVNVSRNTDGQLISITVQNSPQSSSTSTESASKSSSNSTRNYMNTLFDGTTRSSEGAGVEKNLPVGE
jgi:hypothetical protein